MTHLRLHRCEEEAPAQRTSRAPRDVLPFPTARERQRSLVAARVGRGPAATPDFQPRFGGDEIEAATLSTTRLIRDVEKTLEAMQHKLSAVREDAAHVYKFPVQSEDDFRPFAA